MALVILNTGVRHFVSATAGEKLWEVLNDEREGTKEEQAYCLKIKYLYLNLHDAPASYLERYGHLMPDISAISRPQLIEKQTRMPYKD